MLVALTILDRGAQYLADVIKTAIRVIWGGISLTALMRSWIAHAVVRGSLGCE